MSKVKLSKREDQIKNLIFKGYSNKFIGLILHIKECTVKFHVTNIYKKENVTSRTQLLAVSINPGSATNLKLEKDIIRDRNNGMLPGLLRSMR